MNVRKFEKLLITNGLLNFDLVKRNDKKTTKEVARVSKIIYNLCLFINVN
jgi:hypothetical protein